MLTYMYLVIVRAPHQDVSILSRRSNLKPAVKQINTAWICKGMDGTYELWVDLQTTNRISIKTTRWWTDLILFGVECYMGDGIRETTIAVQK